MRDRTAESRGMSKSKLIDFASKMQPTNKSIVFKSAYVCFHSAIAVFDLFPPQFCHSDMRSALTNNYLLLADLIFPNLR